MRPDYESTNVEAAAYLARMDAEADDPRDRGFDPSDYYEDDRSAEDDERVRLFPPPDGPDSERAEPLDEHAYAWDPTEPF